MNLKKMRVLVTGGGSGIGEALAITFARHGASVIICGRNLEKLEMVRKEHSGIRAYKTDITIHDQITTLKTRLDSEMDGIDILVNNAGRMVQFDIKHGIPKSASNEIELNFIAALNLIDLFLPQLMSRNQSAIINVSSGYALAPARSAPVYCATKAALHSFTKSLRWQLEDTPVKVIEIFPPVVATSAATVKGGVDPQVFANIVVRQIEKSKTEIKVGQVMLLAITRHLAPGIIDMILKKR